MRQAVCMLVAMASFAGCFSSVENPATGDVPSVLALPADYVVPGTKLVSQNATEAVFRWSGTAAFGAGDVGATTENPRLGLPVPAGLPLRLRLELRYAQESGALVGIIVSDANGVSRCREAEGGTPVGNERLAVCQVDIGPLSKQEAWVIHAQTWSNVDPEVAFRLDIRWTILLPQTEEGAAWSTVIDGGWRGGEPSMAIAPDGTFFVTAFDASWMSVYRAQDPRQPWAFVGNPIIGVNSDPLVAVDAEGAIWVSSIGACASVATSRNRGDMWSMPNHAACGIPGADRPIVVPTTGGDALLAYWNRFNGYSAGNLPNQADSFYLQAARTRDYGASWTPGSPVTLGKHVAGIQEFPGWPGNGFWNREKDSVFLTFTWWYTDPLRTTFSAAPAFAMTRDDGLSWIVGKLPRFEGGTVFVSLVSGAADEAGNVYLTWAEFMGNQETPETHVYFAYSKDEGASWSDKIRVDRDGSTEVFPVMTAGAAGEIAIGFYQSDAPGRPQTMSNETLWNVSLVWTRDAFAKHPSLERLTLSDDRVKRGAICAGNSCPANREFRDFFDVERLPDGRLAAVHNSMEAVEGVVTVVYSQTTKPLLSPWRALKPEM